MALNDLRTNIKIIQEIFNSKKSELKTEPLKKQQYEDAEGFVYLSSFIDLSGNNVSVIFEHYEKGNPTFPDGRETWNIGFHVEESETRIVSPQSFKQYLETLNSVFKLAREFIKKENPKYIFISPDDKVDMKQQQKGKIYREYIKQSLPSNFSLSEERTLLGADGFLLTNTSFNDN